MTTSSAYLNSLFVFNILTIYSLSGAAFVGELINGERSSGKWNILISSLLTPGDILAGYFWLSYYPLVRWSSYLFPFLLVGGILSGITIPGLVLFCLLVLVYGASITVGSIYGTLIAKKKGYIIQKTALILGIP